MIAAIFVVLFIAYILYATLSGPRFRVEVCMTYGGRSACRTVHAKSEAAALRSATENACADIASGVTDTIRCQHLEPKSVRWIQKPSE